MSTAYLSSRDPALLDGVRSCIADCFAGKITEIVPEISEFIDFEASSCANLEERRSLALGSRALLAGRDELAKTIVKQVVTKFDARLRKIANKTQVMKRTTLDTLSLVDDEQLLDGITINNCAKRLSDQCDFELFSLTQRVCMLLGRDRMDDAENPVFPGVLAEAFMDSLAQLRTDARVRLCMFKAFGPVLLDLVPEIYAAANAYLIERGIELVLETPYGRPIISPERPFSHLPTPSPMMTPVPFASNQRIDILTNLFSPLPVRNGSAAYVAPSNTLRGAASSDGGIRHHSGSGSGDTNTANSSPLLRIVRSDPGEEAGSNIGGGVDEEKAVISEVIAVTFDRLLADERIVPMLKPILARLQGPVLAIGFDDPTLFSNPDHFVRRFIDLVAEYGMTVAIDGDTVGVQSVARIVDTLVQNQAAASNAFLLAYRQLDELFYHHEESALLCDPWLQNLLKAEAVESAVLAANIETTRHLQLHQPSPLFRAFVQGIWRDVLVRDYLNGGIRGDAWKLGVATMDELFRSVATKNSQDERDQLAHTLPSLIALLQDGAEDVKAEPAFTAEFLAELQRVHTSVLHGEPGMLSGLEPDMPVASAKISVTTPVQVAMIESKNAALSPATRSPSSELATLGLACGSWVEMKEAGEVRHWRLNWVTPIKGSCIFKHHLSQSVQVMRVAELRRRLRLGEVTIIKGLGLATAALAEAFAVISRKARRDALAAAPFGQLHGAAVERSHQADSPDNQSKTPAGEFDTGKRSVL